MAAKVDADLDFQSVAKVQNLPTPSSNGDAVNKQYVDDAVTVLRRRAVALALFLNG